ncbi:MAG: polyphosphate polymerase domain-containing protein [Clostridiales bacterium]|jgi:hypothetical protein|nr:polyphosphate polymerase domain-containing protein [Clostridiales bacterium]MDR2751311.1 polyphosphate polymerase domain-containing protein [Clostridiales bacterium]
MAQYAFNRREAKYLLDEFQLARISRALDENMKKGGYGSYGIRNVYFDTDSFDIARMCADKPYYKEKLRIRSYGQASPDGPVFIELKKKLGKTTFKRRVMLPNDVAFEFMAGGREAASEFAIEAVDKQVLSEIARFLDVYPATPKMFVSYDRIELEGISDPNLRITIDTNIRQRATDLTLCGCNRGDELLPVGSALMEVKCLDSMPMWLVRTLGSCGAFEASFSKYGESVARTIKRNEREAIEIA